MDFRILPLLLYHHACASFFFSPSPQPLNGRYLLCTADVITFRYNNVDNNVLITILIIMYWLYTYYLIHTLSTLFTHQHSTTTMSHKCFLNVLSQSLLSYIIRTQHTDKGSPVCWLLVSRCLLPVLEHIRKTLDSISETMLLNGINLRLVEPKSNTNSFPLGRYLDCHILHKLKQGHCSTCIQVYMC